MEKIKGNICSTTVSCIRAYVETVFDIEPEGWDETLAPDNDPFVSTKCGAGQELTFQVATSPGTEGENVMYWSDLRAVAAGLDEVLRVPGRNYLVDFDVFDLLSGRQFGFGSLREQGSSSVKSPAIAGAATVSSEKRWMVAAHKEEAQLEEVR